MRTKTTFSLIILSALLLSACTVKPPVGDENMAGNDESSTESSSSLRDLLALGKNQKCTVTTSVTDENSVTVDTSSTIYISGKKMYQEVQVKSNSNEGLNVNTRMVSDGTYIYSWDVSRKTSGMKFKIDEPTVVADSKTQNQSVDMDGKVDMKCSSWIVNEGKFAVPTDIEFTDLAELMKNIPTMPANIPTGD